MQILIINKNIYMKMNTEHTYLKNNGLKIFNCTITTYSRNGGPKFLSYYDKVIYVFKGVEILNVEKLIFTYIFKLLGIFITIE